MPLTFNYKGLKKSEINAQYLGADEAGVQMPNGDYAGSVEILIHPKLEACKYKVEDFRAANAGISFKESELTREINGKYTWVYLAGEDGNGVKVAIEWYDDNLWHTLSCFRMSSFDSIIPVALEFARELDLNHEI